MGFSLSKFTEATNALRTWQAGTAALVALLAAVSYKIYSGAPYFFSTTATVIEFPELRGGRIPHYSMFSSSFVSSIWPLTLLAMALAVLALRLIRAMARSRDIALVGDDEESGSSAVEFVLVMPPLAVLLLMILQIALIVQAKFVVNYAAFCAARSAIVVIPDDVSAGGTPEPRNQLANPDISHKLETVHRAAALPLTSISPLPGFNATTGVPFLTDTSVIVDLLKLAPFDVGPRSMMGQVMLRAPYAYHPENTAVKVLTQEGAEGGSFQDHDWVTVKVSYRYYLAVPFAKKLLGTSYSGNPIWTTFFGSDYYYPIVEEYTLPVDGEPMLH